MSLFYIHWERHRKESSKLVAIFSSSFEYTLSFVFCQEVSSLPILHPFEGPLSVSPRCFEAVPDMSAPVGYVPSSVVPGDTEGEGQNGREITACNLSCKFRERHSGNYRSRLIL